MIRHFRATFLQNARAALCVFATLFAPVVATATDPGYTVDQSHVPEELWSWWSIRSLGPTGQEFVPQHAALDVVELWISHGMVGVEPPTDVFARIREGSITGPILGTSGAVTVIDNHEEPVRFDFEPPIALEPGNVYVIEAAVVDVPGAGNPMIAAAPAPGYAPGACIVSGAPVAGSDMWFRTGSSANVGAEPTSWGEVKTRYVP